MDHRQLMRLQRVTILVGKAPRPHMRLPLPLNIYRSTTPAICPATRSTHGHLRGDCTNLWVVLAEYRAPVYRELVDKLAFDVVVVQVMRGKGFV